MTEFRLAKEEDLENIVATYNASVPSRMATADLAPVSVESKLSWFKDHNSKERPIWIVNQDSHYAGWMSFSSFYGRPAYQGTAELSIYLDDEFKGRGIGKTCLAYALEKAPELGIHHVLGFIFAHNEASLKLFASFGFQQWGLLPAVANMDGIKRDLMIVGRKLS